MGHIPENKSSHVADQDPRNESLLGTIVITKQAPSCMQKRNDHVRTTEIE